MTLAGDPAVALTVPALGAVLIALAGPDKKCTYVNKRWLDFTGRKLEVELGYGWTQMIHPEDAKRCVKTYERAFDARKESKLEFRMRRHDGEYRWILASGVARRAPDGSALGYIGSCIDINDRKQAEEALRLSHDDLERHVQQRTAELEHAVMALRTEMAERSARAEAERRGIKPDDVWRERDSLYLRGRVATPGEVAELIAFLASEESSGINGESIRVALGNTS